MSDILALSSLLQPSEGSSAGTSTQPVVTPATFGPPKSKPKARKDPKAIWDPAEVPYADEIEAPRDDRPVPQFYMFYKQDVDAGDVFLGTSDKTPGSQDCTHLVYKVFFPDAKGAQELELDVKKQRLVAESSSLRLDTFLPMPVDSENGKAQWDAAKKCLCVTLPILLDEL
uniref:PIH1D1/2/3 CS-like domain-containing protein n=1 Tax=Pinguiococcus pyrenoidosus TaxID=172671 RepID=A0A7R9UGX0_9STRA|eukprot:scaffold613_cov243-Pinguiococcus_pyrenoidosus.AAC.34